MPWGKVVAWDDIAVSVRKGVNRITLIYTWNGPKIGSTITANSRLIHHIVGEMTYVSRKVALRAFRWEVLIRRVILSCDWIVDTLATLKAITNPKRVMSQLLLKFIKRTRSNDLAVQDDLSLAIIIEYECRSITHCHNLSQLLGSVFKPY
jgi:hypothetical protein